MGLLFYLVPFALPTLAISAVLLLVYVWFFRGKPEMPHGYQKVSTPKSTPLLNDVNDRNNFKPSKIPSDPTGIDYVVIGSGIAGLYSAALLSKIGKKVVVLEQHYIAGGCMHIFEDKGFKFDTGIHYLGKVKKYGKYLDFVLAPEHKVRYTVFVSRRNFAVRFRLLT